MNFTKILAPVAIILLTVGAWRQFGWAGIALAGGGVVMWILLHFTRMLTILKKASDRPIGHVASAVMLNAKLKKGVSLMHVIAMTSIHLDRCRSILGHLHLCGRQTDRMDTAAPRVNRGLPARKMLFLQPAKPLTL
jgi:hypothetical protein